MDSLFDQYRQILRKHASLLNDDKLLFWECLHCLQDFPLVENKPRRFNCSFCFSHLTTYCQGCRPFFLACIGKRRYICLTCIGSKQQYKRSVHALHNHWKNTIGKWLHPHICPDLDHLIWQYVITPPK